jgi:hypothetical protein
MKQQYRLTLTGIYKLDGCAASTNQSLGKAGEKAHYYLRRSVVENSLGLVVAIEIDAAPTGWHDLQALRMIAAIGCAAYTGIDLQ